MTTKELFKTNQVQAASIEDFLSRYYKADRYTGRGEEYAATLKASYEREFQAHGYALISRHDSVTGQVVAYIGAE